MDIQTNNILSRNRKEKERFNEFAMTLSLVLKQTKKEKDI